MNTWNDIAFTPSQVEQALKTEVCGGQAVGNFTFLSAVGFNRAWDQCLGCPTAHLAIAVKDNRGLKAERLRGKMEKMKEKVAEKDPDSNRSALRHVQNVNKWL